MCLRLAPPLLIFVTLLAGRIHAGDSPKFAGDVLPLLKSHCIRCHGPEIQEARIRLDRLSSNVVDDRAAAETWHEVRNVLNRGQMPPEGEPQLAESQRQQIVDWISNQLDRAAHATDRTDGRAVLRRLNRVEYQNTMTDLLGTQMDFTRDLPPDSVSRDGFANDGDALQISALQLEAYLETARRALQRVVVSGPEPRVFDYTFDESNVGGWLRGVERSNRLQRMQRFLATMKTDYPEEGDFLIRAKVSVEPGTGNGLPILEASLGYRPDTKILFREIDTVELSEDSEQVFEFRGRLEDYPMPVRGQGKFPGLVVRLRNAYDDGSPLPKALKGDKKQARKAGEVFPHEPHLPTLVVHSVEFHAPVFDSWPPAAHRNLLFDSPLRESDESQYIEAVVRRFAARAFRRPATNDEVKQILSVFHDIRSQFPTFEEAARETLAYVLIRPEFLYLVEPGDGLKRPATDWELASRLSYFLWSTMPDEQLLQLASDGKLLDPNVLGQQVERLLNDPRATRFVDQFTSQWLGLDVVDHVAVNPEYYPEFDNRLKVDMQEETRRFFGELLASDQSAMSLLDADFTMLNERLARHYGIDGVHGTAFRRVPLTDEHRLGGLLGHGSTLLANSTGEDSHPVRRAVWIRDRLLNSPPPSPPPNVPTLDDVSPEFLKLPVREQLEHHRNTTACASCHRGIDPWGIALEHYDAVGLWREEVRRRVGNSMEATPVDAADTLPDGTRLDGADSLRSYLIEERSEEFARALVERLATYALGRRLTFADDKAVTKLTQNFLANDCRLRRLVREIVLSEPFRTK